MTTRAFMKRKRGQAAVELALTMLLIVPIFLYYLFLEDLLRHKLTLQEVVVSTPWDYVGVDYERFNGDVDSQLGNYARLMWCDHSSAYNSYDTDFECGNDDPNRHHKAVSAHVCWLVQEDGQGQNQVRCDRQADVATGYFGIIPGTDEFKSQVNKGGAIHCTAYTGVLNYFLPQTVFGSFTDEKMTDRQYLAGSAVHDNYGALATNVYRLTRQHFTVLHDPWAQTTVANVSAPGSGVLQERTQHVYGHWSGLVFGFLPSLNFFMRGMQNRLISPIAMPLFDSPFSDNLMQANVSFSTSPGGQVDNHYTSPWMDWQNNPVQTTYNNRGRFYMGATQEPQ